MFLSGAIFTDTVYTHPSQHPIAMITGLQTALNGKISTTHESNKIGSNNVNFGAYNSTMRTVTLVNTSGVTLVLEVDNGGNLNLNGSDGVITVPILNAWSFLAVKMDDGAGNIRNLTSNLTGGLLFDNIQLATLTDLLAYTNTAGINTLLNSYTTLAFLNSVLSNYTPTTNLTTLLNAKQNTLTAGTNITISGNTISATSGGATQAWVTANFLSPLNPGTVGVGAGLSANMTANSLTISVD